MGREIRRVPPGWEHPQDEHGQYKPLFDQPYREAAQEWKDEFEAFERGERPDAAEGMEFWEWDGNPPDPDQYRPEYTEKPTWFQVYETVSEGTPVTPPFETKAELIDYLVEHGDFWFQKRPGEPRPTREAATAFVDDGWAPSLAVTIDKDGRSHISAGINTLAPSDSDA